MQPRPPGEPAALEAVSTQLSDYASRLEDLAAGIPTILPLPVFIGPGRAAHDAEFDQATSQARAAANTLELESRALAREAGDLRHRQHAWDVAKRADDDRKRAEAEKAAAQCLPETPR